MLSRAAYMLLWNALSRNSLAERSTQSRIPARDTQALHKHSTSASSPQGLLTSVLPRFDALIFDTGCFLAASQSIYVECEHLTFAEYESQRSSYAIRLTLCELSVAGISAPVQCQVSQQSWDIRTCLQQLELRPQWWTTFSGYFREVCRADHALRQSLI